MKRQRNEKKERIGKKKREKLRNKGARTDMYRIRERPERIEREGIGRKRGRERGGGGARETVRWGDHEKLHKKREKKQRLGRAGGEQTERN